MAQSDERVRSLPAWNERAFGLYHHTWPEPTNFFYGTAEEAQAAINRVYGEHATHVVIERRMVVTSPGPHPADATDAPTTRSTGSLSAAEAESVESRADHDGDAGGRR